MMVKKVNDKGVRLIMTRASRAKQFVPFDALSGFKEALKEKEIKKMPEVLWERFW